MGFVLSHLGLGGLHLRIFSGYLLAYEILGRAAGETESGDSDGCCNDC
jgi:hypothetical protein